MSVKIYLSYHDNLAGFAETWIDTGLPALNYPPKKLADYLKSRMAISGLEVVWDYIRVTDLDPTKKRLVNVFTPTDARFTTFSIPLQGGYQQVRNVGKPESADFGGTRFLMRKNSPDLHQARTFFAGMPDNQVDRGGLYTPTGVFPGLLTAWINIIKGNAWGWNSYTTPLAGYRAQLQNIVSQIDGTAIITALPFGANPAPFRTYAVGDHFIVRIANQNSPRNANGVFTVIKISDTTCRTVRPLSIANFVLGNGTIAVQQTLVFQVLDTMRVMKVVKRGPGRPYGLYRGKRGVIARG